MLECRFIVLACSRLFGLHYCVVYADYQSVNWILKMITSLRFPLSISFYLLYSQSIRFHSKIFYIFIKSHVCLPNILEAIRSLSNANIYSLNGNKIFLYCYDFSWWQSFFPFPFYVYILYILYVCVMIIIFIIGCIDTRGLMIWSD